MRYQVIGRRNLPGFPAFWDGTLSATKPEADAQADALRDTGLFALLDVQAVTRGTVISEFGQRYAGDP